MIWRGSAEDTMSDKSEKNERNLDKGVAKMFKAFPPALRKAKHRFSSPHCPRSVVSQSKRRNHETAEDKSAPVDVVIHRLGLCRNTVSEQSTGADHGRDGGQHSVSVPRRKCQTSGRKVLYPCARQHRPDCYGNQQRGWFDFRSLRGAKHTGQFLTVQERIDLRQVRKSLFPCEVV